MPSCGSTKRDDLGAVGLGDRRDRDRLAGRVPAVVHVPAQHARARRSWRHRPPRASRRPSSPGRRAGTAPAARRRPPSGASAACRRRRRRPPAGRRRRCSPPRRRRALAAARARRPRHRRRADTTRCRAGSACRRDAIARLRERLVGLERQRLAVEPGLDAVLPVGDRQALLHRRRGAAVVGRVGGQRRASRGRSGRGLRPIARSRSRPPCRRPRGRGCDCWPRGSICCGSWLQRGVPSAPSRPSQGSCRRDQQVAAGQRPQAHDRVASGRQRPPRAAARPVPGDHREPPVPSS